MREIKFRAWDKEAQKMIVPNQAYPSKQYATTIHGNPFSFSQGRAPFTHWYENLEIMQYTGLHDKNGKEMFHKDIVKITAKSSGKLGTVDKRWIGVIEWDEKNASFFAEATTTNGLGLKWRFSDTDFNGVPYKYEVIGDVYSTPELLTKQIRIEVIEVIEDDGEGTSSYGFPIRCPRWLFNILEKLEI